MFNFSSAISIKATVYPDSKLNVTTIRKSVSWSFLQLFTTDTRLITQTDDCKKSQISSKILNDAQDYCINNQIKPLEYDNFNGIIGSYSNFDCPAQTWPAYFTIFEYLFFLKLIIWPVLFALFARTAKRVDEEAEKIWKYQLYTLTTNFRLNSV